MSRYVLVTTLVCGVVGLHLAVRQEANAQFIPSDRVIPATTIAVGPWKYAFELRAWGTRSEGDWGALSYDGKELSPVTLPNLEINDYVHTAWGTLHWHGISKHAWGPHGWYPVPFKGKLGQRRVPSNAAANECLLAEADDGTTVRVPVKTRVLVRLNQAKVFDHTWELKDEPKEVLFATSRPVSRRNPLPSGWSPGATVLYAFLAERPGTVTLEFIPRPSSPDATTRPQAIRMTVIVVLPE